MSDDKSVRVEVAQELKHSHPVKTLLLWDVMKDPESRPVIYWVLGTLLFGMFVYHWLEGWSYLNSLYFCVISLATIGYGDFTPTTDLARAFTIFYVINGIGILLALFDRIRVVRTPRIEQETQAIRSVRKEDN